MQSAKPVNTKPLADGAGHTFSQACRCSVGLDVDADETKLLGHGSGRHPLEYALSDAQGRLLGDAVMDGGGWLTSRQHDSLLTPYLQQVRDSRDHPPVAPRGWPGRLRGRCNLIAAQA